MEHRMTYSLSAIHYLQSAGHLSCYVKVYPATINIYKGLKLSNNMGADI